jgi:hypothetical protein
MSDWYIPFLEPFIYRKLGSDDQITSALFELDRIKKQYGKIVAESMRYNTHKSIFDKLPEKRIKKNIHTPSFKVIFEVML